MLLLMALAGFVQADEAVIRVGDAKGMYHALLSAAGELSGLSYRVDWADFPATAPYWTVHASLTPNS